MEKTRHRLALRGGEPYRSKPFAAWPEIDASDVQGVLDALQSGNWSRAHATDHLKFTHETVSKAGQFERSFAERVGAPYGVFVNSGTSALHLIFQALELAPGSEIITTPYTFFSTIAPLFKCGLRPVFVDIDASGNLDASRIESALTERTKAVLILHCGGHPCQMDELRRLCDRYGLLLIQDNAHALTSAYQGKHVAAYGDLSMFSFEASKSLNCGEGGFVAVHDEALFQRMFSIHSCGRPFGGDWRSHVYMSENYRPTELQASLALTQLAKVDEQQRRKTVRRQQLDELLRDHPLVEPIELSEADASHGNYGYLLKIRASWHRRLSGKRLAIFLETEGIPCHSGYTRLAFDIDYSQRMLSETERDRYREQCPVASQFVTSVVWLPQTVLLGSEEDVRDIAGALDKITACLSE